MAGMGFPDATIQTPRSFVPEVPNYQAQYSDLGNKFAVFTEQLAKYPQDLSAAKQLAEKAKNLKDTKAELTVAVANRMKANEYSDKDIQLAVRDINNSMTADELFAKSAHFFADSDYYEANKDDIPVKPTWSMPEYGKFWQPTVEKRKEKAQLRAEAEADLKKKQDLASSIVSAYIETTGVDERNQEGLMNYAAQHAPDLMDPRSKSLLLGQFATQDQLARAKLSQQGLNLRKDIEGNKEKKAKGADFDKANKAYLSAIKSANMEMKSAVSGTGGSWGNAKGPLLEAFRFEAIRNLMAIRDIGYDDANKALNLKIINGDHTLDSLAQQYVDKMKADNTLEIPTKPDSAIVAAIKKWLSSDDKGAAPAGAPAAATAPAATRPPLNSFMK